MNYLSLFTGIGGFDLGFDRAGMTAAGQVETDSGAQFVLEKHWPGVPRLGDVREVKGDEFGTVDLICGGFPCQDVSVAGKREGLAGERSGLWYEFLRIISSARPGWVIIENVPGLLSSHGGRDFAAILHGLVELGYGVVWRVLDAQYFGVAQQRRRVFIVGHLGDGRAAEVLFEREGGAWDSPPRRETRPELARDIAASLRTRSPNRRLDMEGGLAVLPATVAPRVARQAKGGFTDPVNDNILPVYCAFQQNQRDEVRLINGDGAVAGSRASQVGTKQQNYLAFLQPRIARNGRGQLSDISPTLMSDNLRQGTDAAVHVLGVRTSQTGSNGIGVTDDRSHTLDGTGSHAVSGHFGVRRLTPLECERLQGFPDGWTAGQSDSRRYRQLGNAVAVPVAEWLGQRIMAAVAGRLTPI